MSIRHFQSLFMRDTKLKVRELQKFWNEKHLLLVFPSPGLSYPTSEMDNLHSSPVFGTTSSKTKVPPSSIECPVKFASLQTRITFAPEMRFM